MRSAQGTGVRLQAAQDASSVDANQQAIAIEIDRRIRIELRRFTWRDRQHPGFPLLGACGRGQGEGTHGPHLGQILGQIQQGVKEIGAADTIRGGKARVRGDREPQAFMDGHHEGFRIVHRFHFQVGSHQHLEGRQFSHHDIFPEQPNAVETIRHGTTNGARFQQHLPHAPEPQRLGVGVVGGGIQTQLAGA